MPRSTREPLATVLGRLDLLLAAHADAALRPGARPAALKKLSKTVLGGAPLPADLETWFRWHDGQGEAGDSLSPDDNRTALTVQGAIDAWRFLSDPRSEAKDFRPSWVPLFENGAGDYVVLETAGKKAGALLGYWHADADRKVEHASLADWALALEAALAKLAKKKSKKGEKIRLDASGSKWTRVATKPRKGSSEKKPVGTVYYWKQLLFSQPVPWCIAWVKAAPDVWLKGMGKPGPEEAIADLQATIDKRRPPADWEWLKSDRDVIFELTGHGVTADGDKKHVGLYEGTVAITGDVVPRRAGY